MSLSKTDIEMVYHQAKQHFEQEQYCFDTLEVVTQKRFFKPDLRLSFNLYVAPYTYANRQLFIDSVKMLNRAKSWGGYHGECFDDHHALMNAFKEGTYKGGWFIPTLDMLRTLESKQDQQPFKDIITHANGSIWSCTKNDKTKYNERYSKQFPLNQKGYELSFATHCFTSHILPVRAVFTSKQQIGAPK